MSASCDSSPDNLVVDLRNQYRLNLHSSIYITHEVFVFEVFVYMRIVPVR